MIFFCRLGEEKSRVLLNHYKEISDTIYNGILKSINTHTLSDFRFAVDGRDCGNLFFVLPEYNRFLDVINRFESNITPLEKYSDLATLCEQLIIQYDKDFNCCLLDPYRQGYFHNAKEIPDVSDKQVVFEELYKVFTPIQIKEDDSLWKNVNVSFDKLINESANIRNSCLKQSSYLLVLGLYHVAHVSKIYSGKDVDEIQRLFISLANDDPFFGWCYDGVKLDINVYVKSILYDIIHMRRFFSQIEPFLVEEDKVLIEELLKLSGSEDLFEEMMKKPDVYFTSENCDNDMLTLSLSDSKNEKSEDGYSVLLAGWKKKYDKIDLKSRKTFLPIENLTEDEVKGLHKGLCEKGYIDSSTSPDRLSHVLSGDSYDGGNPVLWIKKSTRNKSPNISSVLNFLRLIGVKETDIDLKKLNCCFCISRDSFKPFKSNNMTKKKSQYDTDLRDVINKALNVGRLVLQQMKNIK